MGKSWREIIRDTEEDTIEQNKEEEATTFINNMSAGKRNKSQEVLDYALKMLKIEEESNKKGFTDLERNRIALAFVNHNEKLKKYCLVNPNYKIKSKD